MKPTLRSVIPKLATFRLRIPEEYDCAERLVLEFLPERMYEVGSFSCITATMLGSKTNGICPLAKVAGSYARIGFLL
jgi:hypothetical protein